MSDVNRRDVIRLTIAGAALAVGATAATAQDKPVAKAKDGDPIKLAPKISKKVKAALATTITVKLKNSSSKAISSAEFAMQDSSGDGDPYVVTVEFAGIPVGSTATKTGTAPTGVEVVLYKIYVYGDAEPYTGVGFGVNATLIEMELTD